MVRLISVFDLAQERGWDKIVLRPETLYRKIMPTAFFGEALNHVEREALRRFLDGTVQFAPSVHAMILTDVATVPGGLLWDTRSRSLIAETTADLPCGYKEKVFREIDRLDVAGLLSAASLPCIPEVHLHLGHPWSHNYGHWVLELLSKARLGFPVLPSREKRVVLDEQCLTGRMASVVQDSLEYVIQNTVRIFVLPNHPILCRKLVYVTPINNELEPTWLSPYVIETAESVMRTIGSSKAQGSDGPGKKLYVSRRGAPRRRPQDERLLEELFLARGFQVIEPSMLSFSSQVAIFSQAEEIVGVFGAGLANCVFCSNDVKLLMVQTAGLASNYYRHLFSVREIRYSEFYGERSDWGKHPFESDFKIDQRKLIAALASLPRF